MQHCFSSLASHFSVFPLSGSFQWFTKGSSFYAREKGRYRYAGQWKHGRFHGCGVYEVNERTIYVGA